MSRKRRPSHWNKQWHSSERQIRDWTWNTNSKHFCSRQHLPADQVWLWAVQVWSKQISVFTFIQRLWNHCCRWWVWKHCFLCEENFMNFLFTWHILLFSYSLSLWSSGPSFSKNLIWIKLIWIWKSHVLLSRTSWSVLPLCQLFKGTLDWITVIQIPNFRITKSCWPKP